MIEHTSGHRINRPGRTILFTAGLFMGAALLLLWSWNTLAVDFFKMPTAQLKHALALELILLAAFLIQHMSRKLLGLTHPHWIRRSFHGTD